MKKSAIAYLYEIPFVRLLVPFVFGICVSIPFDVKIPFAWGIIFSTAIVLAMLKLYLRPLSTHHWLGVFIHILLFLVGFQLCYEHDERNTSHHFSNSLTENSLITLKISEIPIKDKWVKFKGCVQSLDSNHSSGNILVYLPSDSLSTELNYGDIIVLNSHLSPISPPQNPNQFNYQSYLHFKNIHYQTFAKANQWTLLETNQGNPLFTLIYKWRTNGLITFQKYLSPDNYSVGAALILGYREALSEEVQKAYADTGAIHVLAVSGLHVGIIALILKYLLGLLFKRVKRFLILQPIIIIICLWLFAFLTGGSPSVLRATTMFSFVTIGLYINRPSSIYNNLAISAFILLLVNPYFIQSVGFQLSYLAVLGIVYFQPKIYKILYIPNKIGDYLWTLTTVAIGAQIGTLPVSLFYFHQFPILFFISGLIVIPAATLILSLGLATLFFEIWLPSVARIFGIALDYVIEAVNWSIFFLQDFPISKIDGIWLSTFGMILLFISIISLIYWIQTAKSKSLILSLSALMLLSGYSAFRNIQNQREAKVVIYSIYKQTAIDIIHKKSTVTLFSKSTDKKSYQFASENFLTKQGIRHQEFITFDDTLRSETIFYNGSILHFNKKTFLILSKNTNWENVYHLKVDYLLICENPYLKIEELTSKIQCDQIIFDASNSKKSVSYWKKDCERLNIEYFDINEKGAWQLNL